MAQYTTDYNALVSLLETFVVDDSSEFTSNIQGIVNRGEERVYRDLDTSLFNTSASTTMTSGVQTITKSIKDSPIRSIRLTASNTFLLRRSREYIMAYGGSGTPSYYYDDALQIYFAPTPDSAYAISINQAVRPLPLTTSNTTNWFATYAADALLWACLVESEAFLIAPERVQEYEGKYAQAIGPIRSNWRELAQNTYDVVKPAPAPKEDR